MYEVHYIGYDGYGEEQHQHEFLASAWALFQIMERFAPPGDLYLYDLEGSETICSTQTKAVLKNG